MLHHTKATVKVWAASTWLTNHSKGLSTLNRPLKQLYERVLLSSSFVPPQRGVRIRDVRVRDSSVAVCLFGPGTLYTVRLRHRFLSAASPWSPWSNGCRGQTGEDGERTRCASISHYILILPSLSRNNNNEREKKKKRPLSVTIVTVIDAHAAEVPLSKTQSHYRGALMLSPLCGRGRAARQQNQISMTL